MNKPIFITGTDTGVGKTFVTAALGKMFQEEGFDIGVMKPVQCGGTDAAWLKRQLNLQDDLRDINPYFAPEPLSPHLAFARQRKTIQISRIKKKIY
jgi:dethiobiotin synthetase